MMSLMRPLMKSAAVDETRLVAGVQPAVGLERLGAFLRPPPIALHDARTLDHQLVVVAELDRDAGERLADASGIVAAEAVDADDRRRLGHAVALQHLDPHGEEEMRDDERHRRAAGDREAQPAAERGAHLARDQPVERRPDQPLDRRRPAPASLAPVRTDSSRCARRARSTCAPARSPWRGARGWRDRRARRCAAPRSGSSAGHCACPRRDAPPIAHRRRSRRRRSAGNSRRCARTCATAAGTRETGRPATRGDALARRQHVGDDVGVRQHHALRPAGRARRVDDRRQSLRLDRPLGRRLPFRRGEPVGGAHDALVVADRFVRLGEHDDALQLRAVGELGREARPIVGAVDDQPPPRRSRR